MSPSNARLGILYVVAAPSITVPEKQIYLISDVLSEFRNIKKRIYLISDVLSEFRNIQEYISIGN
jgi:hypothetical protein